MEYKYYTAVKFDTVQEATVFTESYHVVPLGETETRYRFPVALNQTDKYCVVVYDLNTLLETDLQRVTIEKINTDFLTLD